MIKRWLRGISLAAFAFVFLGACTGPLGTAMSGLLGAGAMFGGQAALNRVTEDVEAKIRWRMKKQEYVMEYTSGLLSQARDLRANKDFDGWRGVMDILLNFHDNQHPETFIMELKRRTAEQPGGLSTNTVQPPGTDSLLQ